MLLEEFSMYQGASVPSQALAVEMDGLCTTRHGLDCSYSGSSVPVFKTGAPAPRLTHIL